VNLAAADRRTLACMQQLSQTVRPGNPPGARRYEKKLIESCRVRPNDATPLEVNEVDMAFAVAASEKLRKRSSAPEL